MKDSDIVESILHGDTSNLPSVLYKRCLPKVRNYIRKNSGSEDDVQDVFQDAIVILIQKVKKQTFNKGDDIDAFVYVVSRNLWINKVKRESRMTSFDPVHHDQQYQTDVLDSIILKEKEVQIQDLLSQTGEKCATLLNYTVLSDFSLKEIAKKLNYANENTAKVYNYRCKKKLIKLVTDKPSLLQYFERRNGLN